MIFREKVHYKKAPILDLGKGFQIIIDFKSWNFEYETQKLPFYKQNLLLFLIKGLKITSA
jgi:hypothetical protein